ncbi:alpha/beta fold hydrolase [Halobaculum sp. D14]|uniref:alpha/beta fold hydrolase n=1 Tax=unclassified Halobaculum TaxID=2640896 RepID=UPI003EB70DF7
MTDSSPVTDGAPDLPDDVPGESRFVEANGRRFHAVEAGPTRGDLVVLLHGFPEFWYAWRDLLRPLADAGHHVVALDQRGYNRSEKPSAVRDYHVDRLAADVAGVVDAYGREEAALVGHDWGGLVAWWVALHSPDRVSALVAANAPHPRVFRDALTSDPVQLLRQSYAAFFQLPALPEAACRALNWRLLTWLLRWSSLPGTFSDRALSRYRDAWSRPAALRSMLHWYRAAARYRPTPDADRVTVPTRVVWGGRDRVLPKRLAYESADRCDDARLTTFDDATHWVHHERPVDVADAVLDELE